MTSSPGRTRFRELARELRKSRTGMIGLALVLFFIGLSVYVPIAVTPAELSKWNNLEAWLDNPAAAAPEWSGFLTGRNLPKTELIEDFSVKQFESEGTIIREYQLNYDFIYDDFPTSLILTVTPKFQAQSPLLQITWEKPNGDQINLQARVLQTSNRQERFFLSTDSQVKGQVASYVTLKVGTEISSNDVEVESALLAEPSPGMNHAITATPLKGEYFLKARMISFDEADSIESLRLSIGGKTFGLFGTDSNRRDLATGILWGAPIALAIGISVSVIGTLIGLILGVFSGYFGGTWKDEGIQRFTDFMIALPTLPMLVLIAIVFRIDIILLVIWLTVFGWMGVTKVTRTIALQIREESYVEAARSLGQRDFSIVFKHIAPQILPYTFAVIALGVPGVIFTEAALSFLGLGDPTIVTWGKILRDAHLAGATVNGFWWWVTIPGALIVLLALGFGLLGNALDRILQPQLKVR